ncbi:MAG TPA: carotenoid oxygenase family protein [Polyangiaceae bacterium]
MNAPRSNRPFHLTGAYAPVSEQQTIEQLEVVGELPADLRGTYVRNGPNPRKPSPAWFAGEGMLHGLRLEGGAASWYRNRFLSADLGPNTSVIRHAGRVLALAETQIPLEVSAELETIGRFDFDGLLRRPMIAHPKTCPTSGELHSISYSREAPHLVYLQADATGRIIHSAAIDVPAATYMHDMALSESQVIFWDLPVLVGDWRSPEPLRWSDDYRPRIGVMRRGGSNDDVHWFAVKPATISHAMNAWDDGDLVVLDVIRAPRIMTAHELYRYTFDLRTGRVSEEVVDPRFVDFPRVHPAVEGRANRFGYAVELSAWETGSWQRALLRKYETATGVSVAHDFGPDRMPGECSIVPRPGAGDEDDAWAVTFVYDKRRETSDFVVLDAKRFDEGPVATVRLPCRVPIGLHGTWLSD